MGLEKPVVNMSVVTPFSMTEKGKVVSSSSYSLTNYHVTSVEPILLSVDFTASKEKFYMIKTDNVIAFGATATDSNEIYFFIKNLGAATSFAVANLPVYECDY